MMQMLVVAEAEISPYWGWAGEGIKPISMYWVLVNLAPLTPKLECPKVCN